MKARIAGRLAQVGAATLLLAVFVAYVPLDFSELSYDQFRTLMILLAVPGVVFALLVAPLAARLPGAWGRFGAALFVASAVVQAVGGLSWTPVVHAADLGASGALAVWLVATAIGTDAWSPTARGAAAAAGAAFALKSVAIVVPLTVGPWLGVASFTVPVWAWLAGASLARPPDPETVSASAA